jgi:hypothetical protein
MPVRLVSGTLRRAEIHWSEAHGIGKRGLKIKRFLDSTRVQPSSQSFALCVEDGGMEDLEARKLYQVLPDREAAREGYIRVVDESGEDYIYPSDLFVPVRLPAAVVRRLRGPVRSRSAAARGTIRRVR